MTNLNWLITEVSSAPENTLLSFWLTELLVTERDMNQTEAARYVAEVQHAGRLAAELLANTKPPTACQGRKGAKSR